MTSFSHRINEPFNCESQYDNFLDMEQGSVGTRNSSSPSLHITNSTNSSSSGSNSLPESCHIGVRCPVTDTENFFSVKLTESIGQLRKHAIYRSNLDAEQAINFGLYLPPQENKLGKFLEDERPVADYPMLYRQVTQSKKANGQNANRKPLNPSPSDLDGEICWLDLIFKSRMEVEDSNRTSRLRKLKTKMSQNSFMDLVRNSDFKTIEKWLKKGFDPNFVCKKDGEAPLTLAATLFHPRELIITLVNGGAHIDFRARDSHTALHRAAMHGVYEAIKTLLDLGQNPNCYDSYGLTPLYYAVCADISARCTLALLYDHAILGVEDDQGFQEIHQACKNNRAQHLENLIAYGVDLNARTKKGATPLHVCIMYEADACLHLLLVRGADQEQTNEDHQTPLDCALLTNRNAQAKIIMEFKPKDLVIIKDPPTYNVSRRATLNGPRGAVYYSQLYHSSLERQSSQGAPSMKSSVSDLLSVDSFKVVPPSPTLSVRSQQQHPLEMIAQSMETRLKANMIGNGFNTISVSTPHQRARLNNQLLPPVQPTNGCLRTKFGKTTRREVTLCKGRDGFGFVLNGVSKLVLLTCGRNPVSRGPANQYFAAVTLGGPADKAGIKVGDYLMAISGEDMSRKPHEDVVNYIRDCGDFLDMEVLTDAPKKKNLTRDPNSFNSSLSSSDEKEDDIYYSKPLPRRDLVERRSRYKKGTPTGRRAKSANSAHHITSPASESQESVFIIKTIDGKSTAVRVKPDREEENKKNIKRAPNRRHESDSNVSSDTSPNTSPERHNPRPKPEADEIDRRSNTVLEDFNGFASTSSELSRKPRSTTQYGHSALQTSSDDFSRAAFCSSTLPINGPNTKPGGLPRQGARSQSTIEPVIRRDDSPSSPTPLVRL